ncbi:MAG: hypothetical protein R2705_15515 [Ilumatobacteraceae bacterium]
MPLGEVCQVSACVSETVVLPSGRFLETTADIELPSALATLGIERVWTGERSGLFGRGWETLWDLRIVGGQLVGPVPARPLSPPASGENLELADGTVLTFDTTGRLSSVCALERYCVDAERSADELRLVARSPSARSVTVAVNGAGLARALRVSDGREIAYSYDAEHRLTSIERRIGPNDPATITSYSYDAEGRLIRLTEPGGDRTVAYGQDGSVASVTDRDDVIVTFSSAPGGSSRENNSSGPSSRWTTLSSAGTRRSYEFQGELLTLVNDDEFGPILERTLTNGRLLSERRPLDGLATTFEANGSYAVTRSLDGEAEAHARYLVDDRGRTTSVITGNDALGTSTMTVAYDDQGHRTRVDIDGAVTSYAYDDAGLLESVVDPDGYTLTMSRDTSGNVVALSDGVLEERFEYDAAGRTVQQGSEKSAARAVYDHLGRPTVVTTADESTSFSYDDAGRLSTSVVATSAGQDVTSLSYTPEGLADASRSDDTELEQLAELGGSNRGLASWLEGTRSRPS